MGKLRKRMSFSRIDEVLDMPDLIEVQKNSYRRFLDTDLREVLADVSPIVDYNGNLVLEFVDYSLEAPKCSVAECRERDKNYAAPLKVFVRLTNRETGEIKESDVFMGDFPLMTDHGTFIINGAERVIVSQLVRSPGAYYTMAMDKAGKQLFSSQIIPNRGAWLEYETDSNDVLWVRIDRNRKMPITVLLRAIGYGTDAQILDLMGDDERLKATLEKGDNAQSREQGLVPAQVVDVVEHSAGGVGVVGDVNRPTGELPGQPGVHGAEQELSVSGPLPGTCHMIQNPLDLGGGEIGVGDQTGGLSDVVGKALGRKLVHDVRRPAALPHDGVVHRPSGLFVPDNGGLPLVGDADGGNLPGVNPGLGHYLHHHGVLAGPDFHGVVLHPAFPGVELGKFLLADPQDVLLSVKEDGPGAGGTLIQGKNIVSHCVSFLSPTGSGLPRCWPRCRKRFPG